MRALIIIACWSSLAAGSFGVLCLDSDVPKEKPKEPPLWKRLQKCVGSNHLARELQIIRVELGEEMKASYFHEGVADRLETGFFHIWPSRGVEMCFDEKSELSYFVLCVEPRALYKSYAKELPGGLRRGDGREAVRKKLGEPTETTEFNWEYKALGVSINFDDKPDGPGHIRQVGIGKPASK